MISHQHRREDLQKRHAALAARLARIEDELASHDAVDWEDLATEREDDEVLEGMGLSGQQEMKQIEAALDRLDAGEYGVCTICGEPISEERLDVLPFTPFCRNCAP